MVFTLSLASCMPTIISGEIDMLRGDRRGWGDQAGEDVGGRREIIDIKGGKSVGT